MARGRRRPISAQERVERSQRAKQQARLRHRGPKGTAYAGRFMDGLFATAQKDPSRPRHGTTGSHKREIYLDTLSDVKRRSISDEDLARGVTRSRLMGTDGPSLSPADTDVGQVRRVTSTDVRNVERMRREAGWQTQGGLYTNENARRGRPTPPATFVSKELPPSHRRWLEDQLADPESDFSKGLRKDPTTGQVRNLTRGQLAPGQRNRLKIYTDALQQGSSHQEALQKLQGERRGRSATDTRSQTRGRQVAQPGRQPAGRRDPYQSVAPGEKEFPFGISSATVDTVNELKRKFPDAGDRELVKIQQYQRMYLADEMQKNQAWAHETRQANITRGTSKLTGSTEAGGERVVFFTTNLGSPAPSVPADSLVGQYVIRRRKALLGKEGIANSRDLQGKFPQAVRDMHIVEASTGISLGAEGRWGAFQKSGWRAGTKKSRNFGKPVPVGQQVLYDSQGRPMYDSAGNIRFTEGATRPFKVGTDRDLGFRIFIG